jgi:hypothetical protein
MMFEMIRQFQEQRRDDPPTQGMRLGERRIAKIFVGQIDGEDK